MSAIEGKQNLINKVADDLERIFNSEEITEEDLITLSTYGALLIEVMKSSTPSKLREAGMNVEIRHRIKL